MAHLLVVEDFPLLGRVIARTLKRAGHQVERAGSVTQALRFHDTFDLAVLDIDLPDGTGVELAERLLTRGTCSTVVFYTGSREPSDVHDATRLGEVVRKERGVVELARAVAEGLYRRDTRAKAVGAEVDEDGSNESRSGTRNRTLRED